MGCAASAYGTQNTDPNRHIIGREASFQKSRTHRLSVSRHGMEDASSDARAVILRIEFPDPGSHEGRRKFVPSAPRRYRPDSP